MSTSGLFLFGLVHSVTDRKIQTKNGEMLIAEVSILSHASDSKGRPVEAYYDLRVSSDQVREGFHNSCRQLTGKPVKVPVFPSIYGDRQQWNLAGLPELLPAQAKTSQAA
jgi:hypothetical protein